MAGRDCGRSRPARKKQQKRTRNEHQDATDDSSDEDEQWQKRRTKRKKRETNLSFTLDVDRFRFSPHSLVVGGSPAAKGQFPYQVALIFERTSGVVAKGGGTIIASQWILTAAHLCKDAKKAIVHAGAYPTVNDAEQITEADLIVMQDAYRTENRSCQFILHDLALLRVKEPFKWSELVKPICLPSNSDLKKDFAGEIAILSGWGKTNENDPKPMEGTSILNFAYEKILSNAKAAEMLLVQELPRCLLAAIGTHGKACSCNGDSGGPLALKDKHGRLIVVGIVSHRIGECGGPKPHMLTRVTSYVDWIQKVTKSFSKENNKKSK